MGRTWDERETSSLVFNMARMKLPKAIAKKITSMSRFELHLVYSLENDAIISIILAFHAEAFIFLTLLAIWSVVDGPQPAGCPNTEYVPKAKAIPK